MGSKPQVNAQAQAWSQAEAKATVTAKAKNAAKGRGGGLRHLSQTASAADSEVISKPRFYGLWI